MADSAGDEAARCSAELLLRSEELAPRKAITSEDLQRATECAELAHERDQKARDRELYRHYEAGAADERAAHVEELAVREGLGDVAAHRCAAQREREAARRTWRRPGNSTGATPTSLRQILNGTDGRMARRSGSCYTL